MMCMRNVIILMMCLCLGLVAKAEGTSYSQLPNVVYAESLTAKAGSTVTMSVKMNNEVAMTGFQFDMVLPEGITVPKDEDGFDLIELSTERTTAKRTDYFNSAVQPDGSIRVMCSSTKSYTFNGNEGEVATVQLNIADTIEPGEYTVVLNNIVMSDANAQTYKVSQTTAVVTIEAEPLIPDNTIYMDSTSAVAGTQAVLSVKMKNVVAMTGFQFDLVLPEGMTVAKDEDGFDLIELSSERTSSKKTDFFNSAVQADGSIRVMASSTKSYTFDGNDGEVATIKVDIDPDLAEGDYSVVMKNIVMSDANSDTYKVAESVATLTVVKKTIVRGDANGDGIISVGDLTLIAAYVLGDRDNEIDLEAADSNYDGILSVGDLTGLAAAILNGGEWEQ